MEDSIKKIKEMIKSEYNPRYGAWTSQRSMGNYDDCFEDGHKVGEQMMMYEIGIALGMDLAEPEEPDYD